MSRRLGRITIAVAITGSVAALILRHSSTMAAGWTSLIAADGEWLGVAAAATAAIWLAGTLTVLGSTMLKLPVGRLFAVQLAGGFVNHVVPASVGGMAVNARFLQRHGASRGAAVASVTLNSFATAVTHTLLMIGALALAPSVLTQAPTPLRGLTAHLHNQVHDVVVGHPGWAVAAACAAVAGLILLWDRTGRSPLATAHRLSATISAFIRRGAVEARALVRVLHDPVRAVALWVGSSAVPILHAVILLAVLRAIASPLPVVAVVVTYLTASAVATLLPSPGGFGALDLTLVGGLVAVGVPTTTAVAAGLGYRLFTVWIPLLPEAFVFGELLRRRMI